MEKFENIWKLQQATNRFFQERVDYEDWDQVFVTGLMSEIGELLQEVQEWKIHRSHPIRSDRTSIGLELSDITKYVLSLWQHFHYSAEEMLDLLEIKSDMVMFRARSEHTIPTGKYTLVSDLDGTLANWRLGFRVWLQRSGLVPEALSDFDPETTLTMDIDMGWPYLDYLQWKTEFERDGGYGHLPCYSDGIEAVQWWRNKTDTNFITVTARPVDITRVLYDTFLWLRTYKILPDQMHMVGDSRVQLCMQLREKGQTVVLLEDDPELATRAASNGIVTIMRALPYNEGVDSRIIRTTDLAETLRTGVAREQ